MSEVGNTPTPAETNTPAPASAPAATPANAELTAMRRQYEDKSRVIIPSGHDMTTFAEFVGDFDETNPITDWTKGTPWGGEGTASPTYAIVEVAETGANRLIAIAPQEVALSDQTVREWAYKQYLRHVLKVASASDASAEKFLTVAGAFRPKFDIEAFKTEAKVLVPFLREKGLKGITTPLLRNAFANAAFAKAQFSRIPADTWAKLLEKCKERAAARGEDVSLFDHFLATRDALTDSGADIVLDFAEIGSELDAALADNDEEETPHPSTLGAAVPISN